MLTIKNNKTDSKSIPDEVLEKELSELLSSLPDDVMLELLTDFGLTGDGGEHAE